MKPVKQAKQSKPAQKTAQQATKKRFYATWIVRHESELSEQELLTLALKNPECLHVVDRLACLLQPFQPAPVQPVQQAPVQFQPTPVQPVQQAPVQFQPTPVQPVQQAQQFQPVQQVQPALTDNPATPIEWGSDKSGKYIETYSFRPEYLLGNGFSEESKQGRRGKYSIFSCGEHKVYVFPTNKGYKVRLAANLTETKAMYEACRDVCKSLQSLQN
jgi:hypothetical protein